MNKHSTQRPEREKIMLGVGTSLACLRTEKYAMWIQRSKQRLEWYELKGKCGPLMYSHPEPWWSGQEVWIAFHVRWEASGCFLIDESCDLTYAKKRLESAIWLHILGVKSWTRGDGIKLRWTCMWNLGEKQK